MQLKTNSVFALIVLVFHSIIFVGRFWSVGLPFAQSSYALDISNDPRNILIKYCNKYAYSVAMGIDVIQDLIGAGLVPSFHHGKTCQEETNNTNHVNLTS